MGRVIIALLVGMSVGWHIRKEETRDRYLTALVERHEAVADYYNKRTDQLIRANEPKGVKQ